MKRPVAAGLIVLALAYLLTPTTSAQTAVMTVEFASVADAGPTERVIVFVGTTACASVSIDAGSPPVALLGTTGQPAACATEDAEITFLQFRSADQQLELFTRTTFAAGGSYELINWAPQPPGSQLPGYMQAVVTAGGVIQPAASGNGGLASTGADPTLAVLAVAVLGMFVLVISGRAITDGRRPR